MKRILFFLLSLVSLASFGETVEINSDNQKATLSPEWKEISPLEIDVNAVKMFANDWMVLSAGKEKDMNMMTIAWGALGELWSKPTITVYVSTSRHTYKYMEENDFFTVTAFPKEHNDKLRYLGTKSGRDEDKVKGSGLTVEYTENGNPIYKEANLAIECKKIYVHQFDKDKMPEGQRQWYEQTNTGVHVMYVGEIVRAWKK